MRREGGTDVILFPESTNDKEENDGTKDQGTSQNTFNEKRTEGRRAERIK